MSILCKKSKGCRFRFLYSFMIAVGAVSFLPPELKISMCYTNFFYLQA